MKDYQQKFEEFDRKNPQVWDLFKRFTFEAVNAGRRRFGSKAVIERIRWETAVRTEGDRFKINENYTAYYARKFMAEFPQHVDLFATRRLRSAA